MALHLRFSTPPSTYDTTLRRFTHQNPTSFMSCSATLPCLLIRISQNSVRKSG